MKACNACHVKIMGDGQFCPLCGEALLEAAPLPSAGAAQPSGAGTGTGPCGPLLNPYPDLSRQAAHYNLVVRLFVFLSVLGGGLSVLINLLVPTSFLWCLIVIAAVAYLWLSVPPLLRRGVNYGARVVFQTLFTSALVVAFDFIIGYRGWSVSYVVPAILCAGIAAIGAMVVFNRTNWAQYVMYQAMMGIFGFIPLVFYLTGLTRNLVMVLVTVSLALASLLVTIIFGDRSIKTEFKKRFHF